MANIRRGRIRWFNFRKGYGFIERSGNQDDLFFHISNVIGLRKKDLDKGLPVEFIVGQGKKGPEAQQVQAVDSRRQTTQKHKHGVGNKRDRFLNPYNFIRPIYRKRESDHVLGDCSPPPHDRHIGRTGRITCKLTVETPLFVTDSHAVEIRQIEQKDEKGRSTGVMKDHPVYRFFRSEGKKPAIPASTLRGAIRSIFEASTNSCFSSMSEHGRLEFRKHPSFAQKLRAGRVLSLPQNGESGKIAVCEWAKLGRYYDPNGKYRNRNMLTSGNWKNGDHAWARVTKAPRGRKRVWQLEKQKKDITPTTNRSETVDGYLKLTGEGIERKVNEYFFFNVNSNNTVPFSSTALEDYNHVTKSQRDEQRIPHDQQTPTELQVGDLIWYYEERGEAIYLSRVRVPRLRYRKEVKQLLAKHLHRCNKYDNLCPACRTFGWVHDSPEKDAEITAFAGRVHFSHAEFDKDDLQQGEKTLAILSSPKPTTTLFYLKKKKKNQSTLPDGRTNYDSPNAHLRGRKMYRHHNKLVWEEATRSIEDASDQNRTIRDFLPKGKSAEFMVEFHNLADEELGALLWSLELGEGMFHRVGYGKPLGFGSVQIEVTQLELLNPVSRYSSDLQDGWEEKTSQRSKLVQAFKDEFGRLYGDGKTFDAMDNVRDLRALLSVPENPDVAIHYPRSDPNPQASDENFTWFLGNKNKRRRPLPFASDDKDGFEYWDRYGKS